MAAVFALPAYAADDSGDILKESVKAAERSAGRYYYNYLGKMKNGAAYQKLYNKLYDLGLRLIESDADFETDIYSIRLNADTPVKWEYDPGDLTYEEILAVCDLFSVENPYMYFMNVMLDGKDIKIFENYSFSNADARKETFAKINSYLNSYSEAASIDDLYKRAEFLHDKVCLNMTYSCNLGLHPDYTG